MNFGLNAFFQPFMGSTLNSPTLVSTLFSQTLSLCYFLLSVRPNLAYKQNRKKLVACIVISSSLGVLAAWRKAVSFVVSVRPHGIIAPLPPGRIFMKFDVLGLTENLLRKFKFD